MNIYKRIINPENITLMKRYISLSFIGYFYVFVLLYLFVECFMFSKTMSFLVVYGSWYILLYILQLKYLFNKKHDKAKLIRFYTSLLFFYISANLLYNLGVHLKINYLISTMITIIILMPFRFIVSKLFVFKD